MIFKLHKTIYHHLRWVPIERLVSVFSYGHSQYHKAEPVLGLSQLYNGNTYT